MLTRLIVASYAWLVEAALWFAIGFAAIAGYHFTPPVMDGLGFLPRFEWQALGALVLPVITLLVLAVLTGPFLILVDIRRSVRSIEARLDRGEDVRRSAPSSNGR
jgi:hypothetical protein